MQALQSKLHLDNRTVLKYFLLALVTIVLAFSFYSVAVYADGVKVTVTATNAQGWYSGDTREGGAVNFVTDATSPYASGILTLTTDTTEDAKAQYIKYVGLPLSQVTDLSYYTKQISGPVNAAASYQLNIDLYGIPDWTTAFVFDPWHNGVVKAGVWQKWDVMHGRFWANDSVPPIVVIGAGNEPFYTLNEIKAMYPDAIVKSFGVYAGTFNPDYPVGTTKQNFNVGVDGLTFNTLTYDFQTPNLSPDSKDACKDGGWMSFQGAYSNQGQCVSSFNHL